MDFPTPPMEFKKGINPKSYNPEKTFFFEKEDGTIFFVNEAEAWNIFSGKQQIIGIRNYPPKLIGTSDGTIYNKAMQEAKIIFKEKGYEAAESHLHQGELLELEEARKHPQKPRDFSSIGLNGRPVNISELK